MSCRGDPLCRGDIGEIYGIYTGDIGEDVLPRRSGIDHAHSALDPLRLHSGRGARFGRRQIRRADVRDRLSALVHAVHLVRV